jgi:tetratricopeptide (TPR) repeat protein
MAMGLFRIRACLQVLVGVWLLWGCASVDQAVRPSGRVWSCDHPADAAVDNEDWLKALKLHQALLEKEPHNCLALYHLGYIRGRLGDRQMEAADYERAVACGYGKDDQLFFNLGMAYAELNQPESAIAAFQRAVDINPASAENHFGWGLAAQSLGRSGQARGAFIQALETDPQHQAARLRLAWILLDEGRLEEGRSHLEILLRKTPGDREALELLRRYEDRRATRYDQ